MNRTAVSGCSGVRWQRSFASGRGTHNMFQLTWVAKIQMAYASRRTCAAPLELEILNTVSVVLPSEEIWRNTAFDGDFATIVVRQFRLV
jgi:hypothetical protein